MKHSSYDFAVSYLDRFINYERVKDYRYLSAFNLDRMRRLAEIFGNPQKKYGSVHVAGTKGKGSTSVMLASVLYQSGYKTGLFTSPHLVDIRERFSVNGKIIGRKKFAKLVNAFRKTYKKLYPRTLRRKYGNPTYFEVLTLLSFLYFAREEVEIAVFEVGLGGRLDSTNVIEPLICVINQVSVDHTKELGMTVKSIANEKAGIIKRNAYVVTSRQSKEVMRIIEEKCRKENAVLIKSAQRVKCKILKTGRNLTVFSLKSGDRKIDSLRIPFIGRHQVNNASVVFSALDVLKIKGYHITKSSIYDGLRKVRWNGRLQCVRKNPTVIIDGAHNFASISAGIRTINERFRYRKLYVIFAIAIDKEVGRIAKYLSRNSDGMFLTSIDSPRFVNPEKLSNLMSRNVRSGIEVEPCKDFQDALEKARARCGDNDIILITGSLYLAGTAIRYFNIPYSRVFAR